MKQPKNKAKYNKRKNAPTSEKGAAPTPKPVPKPSKYGTPNRQVMDLVFNFLKQYGYSKACHGIRHETQRREALGGYTKPASWTGRSKGLPGLENMFKQWQKREKKVISHGAIDGAGGDQAAIEAEEEDSSTSSSSGDETDDESTDSDEWESDASDSDSNEEGAEPETAALTSTKLTMEAGTPTSPNNVDSDVVNALKRKRSSSSSSSEVSTSSASDESESSSEEESLDEPQAKKIKQGSSVSNSASETSSAASSSDASSSGDSDDKGESSDASEEDTKAGKSTRTNVDNVPNPKAQRNSNGSDSSSNASSDSSSQSDDGSSDSESEKSAPTQPTTTGNNSADEQKASSDSSVTLAKASPEYQPPIAGAKQSKGKRKLSTSPDTSAQDQNPAKIPKKKNTPFSRIPDNVKVDPRFASNEYVSYDYADRAYQDLSVTKGKGFTKEKNKKKRGAYRGGMIDIHGTKSIKFDD
ncbi:hypothetical protein NA57DRAFT_50565 [Rhizodiscina lignyota]|uniref:Srp40 C-terminal domain-containing protein n=1 Tax=Rhizodiscina lignyota TaxID=1504668 RepID=A0A9P4IM72_9PEZI|nr:hypothetical protein NA57DRAFT_50565 [Rhizodiscina lignyota]